MTETLTETQEERLRENGYFVYQGCHFKPVRQFTEKDGDFFEKTRQLRRDDELGMMEADYDGKQKHPYSYEGFYAASTDKEADIFFCLETMKEYTPCTHELQEYVMEQEKSMTGEGQCKGGRDGWQSARYSISGTAVQGMQGNT